MLELPCSIFPLLAFYILVIGYGNLADRDPAAFFGELAPHSRFPLLDVDSSYAGNTIHFSNGFGRL
jgi:hypothetical protein